MNEQTVWALTFAAYVAGLALSIVIPYFMAWLQDKVAFDWRMVIGRVLAGIGGALPLLLARDVLAEYSALVTNMGIWGYLIVALYGAGVSWAGRATQKGTDYVREARAA